MELTFSELRAKEVVNTQDGKKLGKVCDLALCYPDNKWLGIIVPSGRGFGLKRNELFIDLKHIVKIGEDVILVNIGCAKKPDGCKNPPPPPLHGSRNFEEYE